MESDAITHMKTIFALAILSFVAFTVSAEPALTIYNQNFAVVRDAVPLDLQAGVNEVRFSGATAHVEPDSVILRDPAGGHPLQILEQNYRNDPVSESLLLSLFEGKTIEFENKRMKDNTEVREIISGKIIRSGYVPHTEAFNRYGQQYMYSQMAYASPQGAGTPIIEVDGKLRFSLPGQPVFPSLGDDTVLKPALEWRLNADKAGKFDAEVSYVSGGFIWSADYNLIAPEKGDTVDLIGWVTMDNQSGKTFENAKIKLMAGDVNKIQPQYMVNGFSGLGGGGGAGAPVVTEKSFDEYHLYTLAHQTTLRDRETKQVEFVRAAGVQAATVYIYDGAKINSQYQGWNSDMIRQQREYGAESNPKVWVMREFVNAETNHLGLPLPKGKLRFYRRNDDGQLEFTGEDTIDHTPKDETVRVFTGNAFDLTGERRQTDFKVNLYGSGAVDPTTGLPAANNATNSQVEPAPWIDERFEIKLRNHKKQPVAIRVVEHLYRGSNWEIRQPSDTFVKKDARTIEFRVKLKPDEEKTISYTAHYWW